MTITLPPERELVDKEERIARILADDRARRRQAASRRWIAPLAASAAAATVIGLSLGYGDAGDGPSPVPPVPDAAATPAPDGPPDVDLWLRSLGPARAAALANRCMAQIGRDVTIEPAEVLSAQVLRAATGRGTVTVVVADDATTGVRVGCEAAGFGAGSADVLSGGVMGGPGTKSTENRTDATHPAIPTDGPGGYSRDRVHVTSSATYQVDDRVARVRVRYVVDDVPGPWYVARADSGWVHPAAMVTTAQLEGAHRLVLETQVLDADGRLLDAPGDQLGGGGISPSPGKTRREDRAADLCWLATAEPGPSTCVP
ncbi:hypothetical protein [Mumia sp. DW29H23]|uniref:hypothetical protein n=1 Tax=Mumia sp. DW29H23 TaxID=3421241 RepID=UPI003D69D5AD